MRVIAGRNANRARMLHRSPGGVLARSALVKNGRGCSENKPLGRAKIRANPINALAESEPSGFSGSRQIGGGDLSIRAGGEIAGGARGSNGMARN